MQGSRLKVEVQGSGSKIQDEVSGKSKKLFRSRPVEGLGEVF